MLLNQNMQDPVQSLPPKYCTCDKSTQERTGITLVNPTMEIFSIFKALFQLLLLEVIPWGPEEHATYYLPRTLSHHFIHTEHCTFSALVHTTILKDFVQQVLKRKIPRSPILTEWQLGILESRE
ncbi:UNVERIFIED_CONTAM: hypothetical protein K2H54_066770 [Gekko kuhli]